MNSSIGLKYTFRRLANRSVLLLWAAATCAFAGVALSSAAIAKDAKDASVAEGGQAKLVLPVIDPERGKRLFVDKSCVVCHAVNGVGGMAGPALDAPDGEQFIDVLDFMARMWRGGFAMIELQGMELGYQLDFTGEELGHIAGFLSNRDLQKDFSEKDVPDLIRDMLIREPYEMGEGLKVPGK